MTGQGIKVTFSGKFAIKVDLVLIFFPYRFLSKDQVLIAKCHTADAINYGLFVAGCVLWHNLLRVTGACFNLNDSIPRATNLLPVSPDPTDAKRLCNPSAAASVGSGDETRISTIG